jgi:prophage regulatory protein
MLMKLPQVMEITTLSRSTIYSWIKAGSFPAPIKLGPRSVAWLKEEVDAWVTARVARTRFGSGDD